MNKVLLLTAVLACLVGGCIEGVCKENDSVTVWALATPEVDSADNEFQGRIGVQRDTIEAGAESSWLGTNGANQSYGAYILTYLAETPVGTPYIGYHATVANTDADSAGFYGPVAGTMVNIGGIDSVVEYQYKDFTGSLADLQADNNDRHRVFAGMRFKF